MFNTLPRDAREIMDWEWSQFQPYVEHLLEQDLTADNADDWLKDWNHLSEILTEHNVRLVLATRQDTTDERAEQAYNDYLENLFPHIQAYSQKLKEKILEAEIEPEGLERPLLKMRTEVEIFHKDNIPLLAETQKLALRYNKILSTQTIEWEGEEITTTALVPRIMTAPRDVKEKAWRMASSRVLEDRDAINENWVKLLEKRLQIAANAGFPDYRAYAWKNRSRFDYTPDDSMTFHKAIEEVLVPVTRRLVYEKRREAFGYDTLRPWDVSVDVMRTTELHDDPHKRPPLKPFDDIQTFEAITSRVFHKVDPVFGGYFDTMRDENLLDLPNRKGKGPGAFCISLHALKRPYLFMNAVGIHGDVQTLFHEAGHGFHSFEAFDLPYVVQRSAPMEFAEVASMGMELLASPYIDQKNGGFYESEADAARALTEHLETLLVFWPYMAVVDGFQHWVYTHPDRAKDPANCDSKWDELWGRFIQGVDWSGLDDDRVTGWHRKLHIHNYPFYYIEYGLAQLGAVQIWANALKDQESAVAAYRQALALGGTRSLPQLFEAAGAKLAFDSGTLKEAADLIEEQIEKLEVIH